MNKRHFEQSMNPKEHIQSELEDAGISHPSEWRKALDLDTPLEGEEKFMDTEGNFPKLFSYLEGDKKESNRENIERFNQTEDRVEKLNILRSMPLNEAVECIKYYAESPQAIEFLNKRLSFYQKLVTGTATKISHESEWDSTKQAYVDVVKEYPIDSSDISQDDIRLGILRDLMQSAMIGTPEMGALKIVNKKIREKENNSGFKSLATLNGYYSGIFENSYRQNDNLGIYPTLIHAYENAKRQIESDINKFGLDVPKDRIEHKAVLKMSDWLMNVYDNYCKTLYYSNSPSRTDPKEALAWAQLGPSVRERILKMRKKLPDHALNFSNIERFIGKCGDNKYESERRRLYGQIKFLKEEGNDEAKREFLERENGSATAKQNSYFEREQEKLQKRYDKSKNEIESLNLPKEEKGLQLESIATKFQKVFDDLKSDVELKKAYFSARSIDELINDLEKRQDIVKVRYEKRKSLADKAFDLQFHFNHPGKKVRNFNEYAEVIDWVNYAPLGTIKRAHKMIQRGMSDDAIMQLAVADIVCGNRQISREDIDALKPILKDAKSGDDNAKNKLQSLLKVGNILSRFDDVEVSINEAIEISEKNFNGMTPAIKEFGFGTVKKFLQNDLDLHTVMDVKNEAVLHGYNLNRQQIINIAKTAHDVVDFGNALRNLNLSQVEQIYQNSVTYRDYTTVRDALSSHNESSDFEKTLEMAQQLAGKVSRFTRRRGGGRFRQLNSALDAFNLNEIKTLLAKDASLYQATQISELLENQGISTNLEEIATFASKLDPYTLKDGIKSFGIDNVRKIVFQEADLDQVLRIKNEIYDNGYYFSNKISPELKESLKAVGLDGLIAIAKAGNLEVAAKTIEAGFTIDEITRFPYLISSLVTKK